MNRIRVWQIARRLTAGVALCLAVVASGGCGGRKGNAARPVQDRPAATVSSIADGIQFEDVAASAGITFKWPIQKKPMRNIEAFGKGCAFLDYDNDGLQDILLVAEPTIKLYHNQGGGRFEDVSAKLGLDDVKGPWTGVAVGDYNGDGFLDIALTGYHRLALLRSDRGAKFVDETVTAGLDPNNHGHWGSSAGFMDLTGRGSLDLVILNYVIMGPHEKQYCDLRPGIISGCPPSEYKPEFGELWRNLGNGKFSDVTASSGMKDTNGKGLVIAFADVDGDGKIDFYIGNDGMQADLMRNAGNLHFKNSGETSGVAFGNIPGHAMAAMGADWADYDRDGRLDLAVPGFADEVYAIFHATGPGLFEISSEALGITGATLKPLGFGTKWIDMDNDGWPDLVFANGHVYDNAEMIDPLNSYKQPLLIFRNLLGKQFVDLAPRLGSPVNRPMVGRGMATGDFDNDGRVDVLIVDYEGAPLLIHNISEKKGHWVTFDLRTSGPNRFAYGAHIVARSGKNQFVGVLSPASSYLSSSDPRIHFGLGDAARLDTVTIRWSDGKTEVLKDVRVDQIVSVKQGKGIVTGTTAK